MKPAAFPKSQQYKKGDVFVIEVDDGVYVYGRVLIPHLVEYGSLGPWRAALCLYNIVDSEINQSKILPLDKVHEEPFITDGEAFFKAIGRVIRNGYLNDSEKFGTLYLRYMDKYWDDDLNPVENPPKYFIDGNRFRYLHGVFDNARRMVGLPMHGIPEHMFKRLKSPDPQFILHFPWQPLEEFLAAQKMDLHMLEDALGELIEEAGFGYYDGRPPPEDDVHVDFQFFVHSPETFAGGVQVVAKWLRERKAPKEVVIEGYSPKKKVMALYSKTIDNLK